VSNSIFFTSIKMFFKHLFIRLIEHWFVLLATSFLLLIITNFDFLKNTFDRYVPNIDIKTNLHFLMFTYLLAMLLPILTYALLKKTLKNEKYKYVPIIFKGNKEIVRFSLYKGRPKEDTYGELLCGKCRILYEPFVIFGQDDQHYCEKCHNKYDKATYRTIIATARSKWIN